jgi:hypothetical protein
MVMMMVLVMTTGKQPAVEKFAGCKTSVAQADGQGLCNSALGQVVAKLFVFR